MRLMSCMEIIKVVFTITPGASTSVVRPVLLCFNQPMQPKLQATGRARYVAGKIPVQFCIGEFFV